MKNENILNKLHFIHNCKYVVVLCKFNATHIKKLLCIVASFKSHLPIWRELLPHSCMLPPTSQVAVYVQSHITFVEKTLREFIMWAPKINVTNSLSDKIWNMVPIFPYVHELWLLVMARKVFLKNITMSQWS